MKPSRLLFVCTGNICRSVSAELIARKKLAVLGWTHVQVASAGVSASRGATCPSETVAALKRRGVDARAHRAQPVTDALLDWADLVLAMTDGHRAAVSARHPGAAGKVALFLACAGMDGDVEDPYGGDSRAHDACAARIEEAVDKLLSALKK